MEYFFFIFSGFSWRICLKKGTGQKGFEDGGLRHGDGGGGGGGGREGGTEGQRDRGKGVSTVCVGGAW